MKFTLAPRALLKFVEKLEPGEVFEIPGDTHNGKYMRVANGPFNSINLFQGKLVNIMLPVRSLGFLTIDQEKT